MKRLAPFVGLALAALPLLSQESSQPTMFVAPFDGDTTAIDYWQPALGRGLAEMLITELGKINKFQMVESTALEPLKEEIRLGDEGYVAQDEKVEKGGWAGADFMFRAKVTRFGAKSQDVDLGGFAPRGLGRLGLRKSKSDVRIDWRVVDVANRKVIKTGQAVAAETGVGFDVGVAVSGHGGNIGFDNKEFMESALGKATVKALNLIIADVQTMPVPASGRQRQKVTAAATQQAAVESALTAAKSTPGKVLAVPSKGVLVVSLGSRHGFKAGDKLKLYETVELKDDKGEVVFTEEKLVGEITLDAVQEERSKAAYTGAAEVKAGWVVKGD
jgi:curli biogenesis system outer membrane secretion channel CsgG